MNQTLEEMEELIGVISTDNQRNSPFVPIGKYIQDSKLDERYACMLLQNYGYRDCDGTWTEEILKHGYITPVSYLGIESTTGLKIRIKNELVGPQAHKFFTAFFKQARMG